jgi:uncharacterized protein
MKNVLSETEIKRVKVYRSIFAAIAYLFLIVTSYGQDINDLKLRNYRPVSIFKVPVTNVARAKYPAIDMHTHVYARNDQAIAQWIKAMDACGIEKAKC